MKQCSTCNVLLPLASFSRNRNSSDGLQYVCRSCDNARRYKQSEQRRYKLDALFQYLRKQGCSVCGIHEPTIIQFHHVDEPDRSVTFSSGTFRSLDALFEELAKCIPVCANDHARIHAGQVSLDGIARYTKEDIEKLYRRE